MAAAALAMVSSAFAVRASLDPTPEPVIEVGDKTAEAEAIPSVDLFLALQYDPLILDEFRRTQTDGLGVTPTGQRWVDSGDWVVDGQSAKLGDGRSLGPSIALVDGPTGERVVAAEFAAISGGAGLVHGYVDAENYWAVVAAPNFALWQVWQVTDGLANLVARVGPASFTEPGIELAVHIRDDSMDHYINGRLLLTINHPVDPSGTGVGLIALREGPVTARWDRFAVAAETDE